MANGGPKPAKRENFKVDPVENNDEQAFDERTLTFKQKIDPIKVVDKIIEVIERLVREVQHDDNCGNSGMSGQDLAACDCWRTEAVDLYRLCDFYRNLKTGAFQESDKEEVEAAFVEFNDFLED